MTETPAPRKRAADRIRESARELFYRQGIRAVGVDEIVSRAGATKPSLYRAFASKDDLAAAYLRDYGADFFERFDNVAARFPGNPRAQITAWFEGLAAQSDRAGFRGCGISNAAVEHPEPDHPARRVALEHKQQLRERLSGLARDMGAQDPQALGDALLLLMEGAFSTGQLFGAGGPARQVAAAADALIEAHLTRRRV